ncbi:MAG: nucleotidyltransferase domain-containing protein [Candidatus Methanomethylicia archaeon]|nr:nucleotidyltransferase domain-containing protein [Candidatus Methanomethylicia archaeon]MDW7988977.1 nucleotidyltransferase domain-containing protein [Nitrososphaerota archaeon]
MREKVVIKGDSREVVYSQEHWKLFHNLREKTRRIMEVLAVNGINCIVHGSIARGDVHRNSDIDILIPYTISSYKVELAIESLKLDVLSREITQATPLHVVKAHFKFVDNIIITFPMMEMRKLEREFYRFGGEADLNDIIDGRRKPGVSKKLLLIEPTEFGHIETPIVGREEYVAKVLGVSIDIVKERERVLIRRDEIGRTGVYLKYVLAPNENFEEVFKRILDRDPAIKRRSRL